MKRASDNINYTINEVSTRLENKTSYLDELITLTNNNTKAEFDKKLTDSNNELNVYIKNVRDHIESIIDDTSNDIHENLYRIRKSITDTCTSLTEYAEDINTSLSNRIDKTNEYIKIEIERVTEETDNKIRTATCTPEISAGGSSRRRFIRFAISFRPSRPGMTRLYVCSA